MLPIEIAAAGGVQATASATISSGVSVISNQEAGSARVIGAEFATFQILGLPEAAIDCEKDDVCLTKMAAISKPALVSFEFE